MIDVGDVVTNPPSVAATTIGVQTVATTLSVAMSATTQQNELTVVV